MKTCHDEAPRPHPLNRQPHQYSSFTHTRLTLSRPLYRFRALQQFEAFHEGESIRLHQFEIMQVANLMQADSEVEEVRCGAVLSARALVYSIIAHNLGFSLRLKLRQETIVGVNQEHRYHTCTAIPA